MAAANPTESTRPYLCEMQESTNATICVMYADDTCAPSGVKIKHFKLDAFPDKTRTLLCSFFNYHYPKFVAHRKRDADGKATPHGKLPQRMYDGSMVLKLNNAFNWYVDLDHLDLEELVEATGSDLEIEEELQDKIGTDEMTDDERCEWETQAEGERARLTGLFIEQGVEEMEEAIANLFDDYDDVNKNDDEQPITMPTPWITVKYHDV
jgi:hypothetical protein